MALIPSFFGNRSSVFDPLSMDLFDPMESSILSNFRPLSDQLRSGLSTASSSFLRSNVDWKETEAAHVFKADLPGLKKEEIKVELEDDRVLLISGERHREQEEKSEQWHRVERSSGKFMRKFRLPENAKIEEVKAAMEDGVLTVTIPKINVKKPDIKSIEISG